MGRTSAECQRLPTARCTSAFGEKDSVHFAHVRARAENVEKESQLDDASRNELTFDDFTVARQVMYMTRQRCCPKVGWN